MTQAVFPGFRDNLGLRGLAARAGTLRRPFAPLPRFARPTGHAAAALTTMLPLLSIIAATLGAMIPFTHIAGQLALPGQTGPNRYGAQPSKVLP